MNDYTQQTIYFNSISYLQFLYYNYDIVTIHEHF